MLLRGPVAGAQSSEPFNPFSAFKASAETWAMSRYGDTKPSLYTGAMHYSVPVYTYQDPDFTLPVSLEYNFDGYRPSQHSGTVGLGWNLNCGGVITRDIRGFPDDDAVSGIGIGRGFKGYYYTADDGYGYVSDTLGNNVFWSIYCNTICTDYPTFEMARSINPFTHIPVFVQTTFVEGVPKPCSPNNYDLTPDIYHFVIPGHSGDFMFMPDGSVRVFNSDLPHGEVKVEFAPYGGGPRSTDETYWCTFSIITGDGTRYEFGRRYESIDYSKSVNTHSSTNIPSVSATAFHLDRIIAPNGRIMEFHYSSAKQVSVSGTRSYSPKYEGNKYNKDSELVKSKTFSYFSVPEEVTVDGDVLISFDYGDKTTNECSETYFDDSAPSAYPTPLPWISLSNPKRLSSIEVHNGIGDVVEKADLFQIYASSGTPKMFLSSIGMLRGGRHSFDYDLNRMFPKNDCKETDHWGYWNGYYLADIRTIVQFSGSRYSQMTSNAKDARFNYARAGAMTQITYPTGGCTYIDYEGHTADSALDEEGVIYYPPIGTSINVGGVRVKRTVKYVDNMSPGDTTNFAYYGGFLHHMPRYLFVMGMFYCNAYGGADYVSIDVTLTGYNADCDYSVSRDNIIGYPIVKELYPDGSEKTIEFSSYQGDTKDLFMQDEWSFFPYQYLPKRGVFSGLDYINEQISSGTTPNIAATPFMDRKNMRGVILSEVIKASTGNLVHSVEYDYTVDAVHLNQVWWNDLDQFDCSPWTCESPLLERKTVTDYADDGSFIRTVNTVSYNDKGQVAVKDILSPNMPGDTLRTRYTYYHESGESASSSALPGALRRVAKNRTYGQQEYTLCEETIHYADASQHINPSRVAINYQGVTENTYSLRDSLFRITQVNLPGGDWVEYDWNGNDIIRVRRNDNANVTQYEWKPLVGVTKITAPSGQMESADYDNRNRLWRRRDTAGRITESYHYKLKNE